MPIKSRTLSTLAFLLAAAAAGAGPALAGDAGMPSSDVTGSVDPRAGAPAAPADDALAHARLAHMHFVAARATMERDLLIGGMTAKPRVAALKASIQGMFAELDVIRRIDGSPLVSSANDARRAADAWYQAGLKIIAPPEGGLTELPLPMLVAKKGDDAATAIEWLVAEASASVPAPSANAAAPKAAVLAPTPHVSGSPRMFTMQRPKPPMTQNQASLRLLRESLPLFLPMPAKLIYFARDRAAKKQ